ncbi:hypothetical protein B0T21DRAFT_443509 [Apiosordaria backusii]|uniref:Uncharacterized protein n=1 Tax=Apiosordaria backusii TaxID=314023 RepID=A0AA40BE05_9PEZI|nr:hypothetical protein B0T21DRAFT_443509 [Apiosordaria backusii]
MEGTWPEYMKSKITKHTMDKARMSRRQSWRLDGHRGLRIRRSDDMLEARPSSPPFTLIHNPLKGPIYELQQYLKLIDRLEAWYSVGRQEIQDSTKAGRPKSSNILLISPVEAEIYKIQRIKTRIGLTLHIMCAGVGREGSKQEESSISGIPPIKLSDLLQRKWDAPHLDRKVLQQILARNGYKPKSKSRVSAGHDLKPSDSDFFDLCDAVERQMMDSALVSGLTGKQTITSSPSPPSTSSPTHPAASADVSKRQKEKQSLEEITQLRPPAGKQQTPAQTTTSSPSRPPIIPLPPTPAKMIESVEVRLAKIQESYDRFSKKLAASQLEKHPKSVTLKLDGRHEADAKAKPPATSIVSAQKVSAQTVAEVQEVLAKLPLAPTVEEMFSHVRSANVRLKSEDLTKPKLGLSTLRHEIQAEPVTVSVYRERQVDAKTAPKTEAKAGVSKPPQKLPAKPRPQPIANGSTLLPQTEVKKPKPASSSKSKRLTTKTPPPMPTDPNSEVEADWVSFSVHDTPTAHCPYCGVEHEDFENLVLDDGSDSDSGVELPEGEGGEEGGLLITNHHSRVTEEEEDDGEELNVKGDYFLAKLSGIVRQAVEEREAIAEWVEDFTEGTEGEGREDGEYYVLN